MGLASQMSSQFANRIYHGIALTAWLVAKPEKFLPVLDFGGNLVHQAPTPCWLARRSSFADARVYNPQWKALLHC